MMAKEHHDVEPSSPLRMATRSLEACHLGLGTGRAARRRRKWDWNLYGPSIFMVGQSIQTKYSNYAYSVWSLTGPG